MVTMELTDKEIAILWHRTNAAYAHFIEHYKDEDYKKLDPHGDKNRELFIKIDDIAEANNISAQGKRKTDILFRGKMSDMKWIIYENGDVEVGCHSIDAKDAEEQICSIESAGGIVKYCKDHDAPIADEVALEMFYDKFLASWLKFKAKKSFVKVQ